MPSSQAATSPSIAVKRYQACLQIQADRRFSNTSTLLEVKAVRNQAVVTLTSSQIWGSTVPRCRPELISLEKSLLATMPSTGAIIGDCWPMASQRIQVLGRWLQDNAPQVVGEQAAGLAPFEAGCHVLEQATVPALMGTAYCGILGALASQHQLDRDAAFIGVLAKPQDKSPDQILQALVDWKQYAAAPRSGEESTLQKAIIEAGARVGQLLVDFETSPLTLGDQRVRPAMGLAYQLYSQVGIRDVLAQQMTAILGMSMPRATQPH